MDERPTYGIDRVPADVDLTAETIAELTAAELLEQDAERWWGAVAPRFSCCENVAAPGAGYAPCRSDDGHDGARADGLMGSQVMCRRHLAEYHAGHTGVPALPADAGPADWDAAIEARIAVERRLDAEPRRCAVCGNPAAWNSGAGQDLCGRHWDSY